MLDILNTSCSLTLCPKYLKVLLNIKKCMKESQLDGFSFKNRDAQLIVATEMHIHV